MTEPHIDELERSARRLHEILRRQARRPFVLEITGTPKAGKTTLIAMLGSFLRACGWTVHVLEERAGACPLPMKGHFFFNTWTTGTMLAGLLDAVDRDDDLVILDRGLLDALVWLQLQRTDGQVSAEEAIAFESFVLVDRWRSLSDATCIVRLDAETAMTRENHNRLVARRGSIMNERRLGAFNEALAQVLARHSGKFDVFELNNDKEPKDGAAQLVELILERVSTWADKSIAVIKREEVERLFATSTIDWPSLEWESLSNVVEYHPRSNVENDEHWVQIVACGAQVHDGEVFLAIRRRQRAQQPSARDDTARLWQGCHIEQDGDGPLSIGEVAKQLSSRLKADLHLGTPPGQPTPLGLVWIRDGKEPRHLGVAFKVPVEQNVANFLDEKDFRTNGRGYLVKSSFVSLAELAAGEPPPEGYTLEEWSRVFLEKKWLP